MLIKISNWMTRVSRGWVALLGLVIFALFTALVLPRQAQNATPVADVGTPDLSLWYSPSELYQMAEDYGAEGRQDYIQARLSFDVIWPLVYTFFLVTSLSWLFGRSTTLERLWRRANLIPLAAMLLDFLENISTSIVMARYPAYSAGIAAVAPFFTLTKWLFVGGSFVLLLMGAGALIRQRFSKPPC